jgi:NAD(P)-dependent dehydrogenase (short-subunit alcohol dehydrogenase family)
MIFDTNVSSVALLMMSFLPLLRASADGRIINVSSTPASLGLSHTMPIIGDPSYIPYMVSKTALNMLTLCYSKIRGNEDVLFQCAGPGLVRTDLNEAARTRPDARTPETGAAVVIELILAERRRFRAGFWYIGDGEKYPKLVPG